MTRPPAVHHVTSHALRFFGRADELSLLNRALAGAEPSVAAFIGPGGQGKTAIIQHWLERLQIADCRLQIEKRPASCVAESNLRSGTEVDALFFWSFYRGKDSDLCLRELVAYAEGLEAPSDVSASYCVDRLLRILPRERWALILDGTEVVQHEQGSWFGRFVHPELGRLLEELASMPLPGVVVLTSRFPMPTLESRHHARVISLANLDEQSAISLLSVLGVHGSESELTDAARACGLHAKAVELLGTYLTRYRQGRAGEYRDLPEVTTAGTSAEEASVLRVLRAHQAVIPQELQDILALATSFRQPPSESRLIEYLHSDPLRRLLHESWGRAYLPFQTRTLEWLRAQIQNLIDLRLLERVGVFSPLPVGQARKPDQQEGPGMRAERTAAKAVLDAHPLVRCGFEHVLGGAHHSSAARAGFLRGRPDRRPPQSLDEAREEIELFHAYADARLWNEADSTLVALDNPKHRFLAPAFERDLLLRFFPDGDWRQPPLWPGFGRYRSLAICLEMLGQFEDALDVYRPADAALCGDALIALGRLQPFVDRPHAPQPWQTLWQAYRAHALALLGRGEESLAVALALVPADIYEWVHVFECLRRLGRLDALDLGSLLYRAPFTQEHQFAHLARARMQLEYLCWKQDAGSLGDRYRDLLDAYDRGGLPFERALTRLSYARWLLQVKNIEQVRAILNSTLELCRRFRMPLLERDALSLVRA